MLINQLAVPKEAVRTISEDTTLQEAIDLLEEYGYRCVPILDSTEKIYRGNIYRFHIYKHKSEGGDMDLPVTHLIKNATKYIYVNSSFFNIFFMIRDLPYITILDENKHFYGILTNNSLIDFLQQSWSVEQGSYIVTVETPGEKGDFINVSKIVNRNSSIMSCITLDFLKEKDLGKVQRIILTLEPSLDEKALSKIKTQLNKKGYSLVGVENLQT